MYFYLYDSFLSDKRYARELTDIEARVADLGIGGKIGRLTTLKSADDMIRQAVRQGAETVVAVGNDETVSRVVRSILGSQIILGIIPLGEPVTMADALGIPSGLAACEVLSARILEAVDIGRVNNHNFLSTVEVAQAPVTIRLNNAFSITPDSAEQSVRIVNFSASGRSNPHDGRFDAVITGRRSGGRFGLGRHNEADSIIPCTKAEIISLDEPVEIIADGAFRLKTPAIIDMSPKQMTIIVGKERRL